MPFALVLWMLASQTAPPNVVQIRVALTDFDKQAQRPVGALTDGQLNALSHEDIVKRYQAGTDAYKTVGVLGLVLTRVPRRQLWLSVRDPHLADSNGLTQVLLSPPSGDHAETWLGVLKLPWPLQKRHWRVQARNNLKLATTTHNRAWERLWTLDEKGAAKNRDDARKGRAAQVTPDDLDGAVYTPNNQGAWFVVEMGNGWRLLGYRATFTAGGAIPDGAMVRYSMFRLETLLKDTLTASAHVDKHYVTPHALIYGGDGTLMPLYRAAPLSHPSSTTPHAPTVPRQQLQNSK